MAETRQIVVCVTPRLFEDVLVDALRQAGMHVVRYEDVFRPARAIARRRFDIAIFTEGQLDEVAADAKLVLDPTGAVLSVFWDVQHVTLQSDDRVSELVGVIEGVLTSQRAAKREILTASGVGTSAVSRNRRLRQTHARRPVGADRRPNVAPPAPRRTGTIRHLFATVTCGSVALVLLTAGTAVAFAQDANPDDVLYGVKRWSEQVWLAVPRPDEFTADVHFALAERRLGEAEQTPTHAERLIAEASEHIEAAARQRPEQAIETFHRLLGDSAGRLPDHVSPTAEASLRRNCLRIADQHNLEPNRCGPALPTEHPGRGLDQSQRENQRSGPPQLHVPRTPDTGTPDRGLGRDRGDIGRPGQAAMGQSRGSMPTPGPPRETGPPGRTP